MISVLRLSHISFAYPGSDFLFSDLTVNFSPGWTALVGDNGIGKTTLIRLALGIPDAHGHVLHPQSGTITPRAGSPKVVSAWCPQETVIQPTNLDDFAANWSSTAITIRENLEIGDDWAYRYSQLSGGQRKRLQIACALASDPDVLVLDEPTNHVDVRTQRIIAHLLSTYARKRKLIGIIISHDRDLIDNVADKCIFLTREHTSTGNITCAHEFSGGYSDARAALHVNDIAAEHHRESAVHTLTHLEKAQASRKAAVQKANALKYSGRKIDPHDHDALGRHKLAHQTSVDGNAGRAHARIASHVNAARDQVSQSIVPAKRYTSGLADLFGTIEPSHLHELVSLPQGLVPWPSRQSPNESRRPGITIPELHVGPRDHIALIGDNGTGKTTLVRALRDRLLTHTQSDSHLPPSRIVWIAQENTPDDTRRAIDTLMKLDPQRRGAVLTGFAQLNSNPDHLMSNVRRATISPGELHKLLLCLGIVTHKPQLVIMDEPTNHLDIGSVEALESGLAAYRGALILVSHDMRFLRACTSLTWKLTFTGNSQSPYAGANGSENGSRLTISRSAPSSVRQ